MMIKLHQNTFNFMEVSQLLISNVQKGINSRLVHIEYKYSFILQSFDGLQKLTDDLGVFYFLLLDYNL